MGPRGPDLTRRLRHLAGRFAGSLRARPPTPAEQALVGSLLSTAQARLFWAQPRCDVRHALDCLDALGEAGGRPELARAALLHDVGKRLARLGVVRRSLASGLAILHLPAPGRLGAYLAHGPAGAAELEAAGSEPLVVAFARHHEGVAPPGVAPGDWELLGRADRS